jgi:hypothetical protein
VVGGQRVVHSICELSRVEFASGVFDPERRNPRRSHHRGLRALSRRRGLRCSSARSASPALSQVLRWHHHTPLSLGNPDRSSALRTFPALMGVWPRPCRTAVRLVLAALARQLIAIFGPRTTAAARRVPGIPWRWSTAVPMGPPSRCIHRATRPIAGSRCCGYRTTGLQSSTRRAATLSGPTLTARSSNRRWMPGTAWPGPGNRVSRSRPSGTGPPRGAT